ncbi:MAG: type I restriction enzyme endonuclease domain-containing protein [Caldimonas sp.]
MTEDQLEQETLGWQAEVGWRHRYGPELAPDGSTPERESYRQVVLVTRLRQAVAALNPGIPAAARDDAIRQVLDLGGEQLGLNEDEVRFYDALANNESAVSELTDETLKKIAHELAENLRKNLTVDWSARESVQARLRLMVKRIPRKYKYPPDQQDAAVELVLQQARALGEVWA